MQREGHGPIGIIGTAGRDASPALTAALWAAMKADLRARLRPGDSLVSGGAAWADHLAVHAYLNGWCDALHLFLPAPFVDAFEGPRGSSGSAANYYHRQFSQIIGEDTLKQVGAAIARGATVQAQPVQRGYGAMFARNAQVAALAQSAIAYTFGEGAAPSSAGTLDTWKRIQGDKIHVSLTRLAGPSVSHERRPVVRSRWSRFA